MSNKVFKHGCLFFALFMMLGHSLVPHQHHNSLSNRFEFHVHHKTGSLLDLLTSTFKKDLEAGHLENYKPQSLDKFSLSTLFIATVFTFYLSVSFRQRIPIRFVPTSIHLPWQELISDLPSRAPPLC